MPKLRRDVDHVARRRPAAVGPTGRPAPLLPSTAQIRSGIGPDCRRIAAYPALSVPNLPVANTVSLSSRTSIVADSLWGSTPMTTLAMTFAFSPFLSSTPGGQCYFELGRPLLSHAPARCPAGTQTENEPHRSRWWAAARRASRRTPRPSLARHRPCKEASSSRLPGVSESRSQRC